MRLLEVLVAIGIIFFVGIFSFGLYMVYLGGGSQTKYHPGDIFDCNQFYEVTDIYKTPGPVYHAVLQSHIISTVDFEITPEQYSSWKKGGYVVWMNGYHPIDIIRLSETETGYRNACQVI